MQVGNNVVYLQSRLLKKIIQDENCTLNRIVRVLCTEGLEYIAKAKGSKDDHILIAVKAELKRRAKQ